MIDTLLALAIVAAVGFIALGLYFLPMLVAQYREQEHLFGVFALNLVFGWTGIGWLAMLIWAAVYRGPRLTRRETDARGTH